MVKNYYTNVFIINHNDAFDVIALIPSQVSALENCEKMLLSNHDTLPSELHLAFEQVTLDYFEVWYNCIVIIMRKRN